MMTGFQTLLNKEITRFRKVGTQTIGAPILTALLYLLIFGHALEGHVQVYPGVTYIGFLIPGLVMMSVLQNAFANTSSSLAQSKMMGNLVFVLLTPLSYFELFSAYVLAAVVRGLAVGTGVLIATMWFGGLTMVAPLWVLVFALMSAAIMASLGLIAGIWADKFDQLALFQNFLIMPATYLAGVFYSVHTLPPFWQFMSRCNPLFYMIDGFRYGFFGQSDVPRWHSLLIVVIALLLTTGCGMTMLRKGYKLRH